MHGSSDPIKSSPQLNVLRAETNSISIKTSDFVQFNLLKPTGHVMHQQFNIQQLYVLPTLYLCGLYLSEKGPG